MNHNQMMEQNSLMDFKNLEAVACNLCGSDDYEILATRSRFQIPLNSVICRRCGLMYLNPRMSQKQYQEFYKSSYRKFFCNHEDTAAIFEKEKKEGMNIWNFCLGNFQPGRKALEIGCGPGGILAALRSKGMEVCGVEPSVEESAYARAQGIPVENAMLEDLEPRSEKGYDAVILSRSLNHFADPKGAVAKMRTLLKEEGVLFLQILDFPAQCRFGFFEECAQADHLYMFSPETARAMLGAAGFEILKMETDESRLRGWRDIRAAAKFHMKILAKKSSGAHAPENTGTACLRLKEKIRRNQCFFHARRLTFWRLTGILPR